MCHHSLCIGGSHHSAELHDHGIAHIAHGLVASGEIVSSNQGSGA